MAEVTVGLKTRTTQILLTQTQGKQEIYKRKKFKCKGPRAPSSPLNTSAETKEKKSSTEYCIRKKKMRKTRPSSKGKCNFRSLDQAVIVNSEQLRG